MLKNRYPRNFLLDTYTVDENMTSLTHKAAKGYFGKDISELSDYECAMLAGIPNAPSAYSPDTSPELARKRTKIVLDNMSR